MKPPVSIGYLGKGCWLPDTVLTNADLERIVDTDDAWIVRRTGIETRRVLAPGETVLDMAVAAAKRALDDAGVAPRELDDIRVGVNSWGRFPSLATQVQAALGARRAAAADVQAGCAGFVYALEEAYNRSFVGKVRDGQEHKSLVIGVDGLSHIVNWQDRETCVLMGDGAGAVVLGHVEAGGIRSIHTSADGRHGAALYSDPIFGHQWATDLDATGPDADSATPAQAAFTNEQRGVRPYLHMDGRAVYGVAVRSMVREVKAVIAQYNRDNPDPIGLDDIVFVYPHQANLRLIQRVIERLQLPSERVYTNGVVRFGNTSAASIPIGYCDPDARPGAPRRPGFEIDVAFGAGFAAGAVLREIV